jgi:hypothetical protein
MKIRVYDAEEVTSPVLEAQLVTKNAKGEIKPLLSDSSCIVWTEPSPNVLYPDKLIINTKKARYEYHMPKLVSMVGRYTLLSARLFTEVHGVLTSSKPVFVVLENK